jgi:flagellar biosynthesis chaperone FliJ
MTDEAPKLIVKVSSSKSLNRKRQIQSVDSHVYQDRNQVIEEVAKEVEKLTGFGKDTIDSLTIYIRNMKT